MRKVVFTALILILSAWTMAHAETEGRSEPAFIGTFALYSGDVTDPDGDARLVTWGGLPDVEAANGEGELSLIDVVARGILFGEPEMPTYKRPSRAAKCPHHDAAVSSVKIHKRKSTAGSPCETSTFRIFNCGKCGYGYQCPEQN